VITICVTADPDSVDQALHSTSADVPNWISAVAIAASQASKSAYTTKGYYVFLAQSTL
jgi:hypothetical protein